MKVALGVVIIVVCVLGGAIGALRARKLRRDELRALDRRRRIDAMAHPNDAAPLRSVRLLDAGEVPLARPEPVRPRLDADHAYVFTDHGAAEISSTPAPRIRVDDRRALERSGHRSRLAPGSFGVLVAVAAVLVVMIVVGALFFHTSTPSSHPSTTTTAPAHTTTTTAVAESWPAQLTAQSTSATTGTFSVPQDHYTVNVQGAHGPVWIVIEMGPHQTLEYQGDVTAGSSYSLALHGDSWISLGSPRNATVTVDGHEVVQPRVESAPYTVALVPRG